MGKTKWAAGSKETVPHKKCIVCRKHTISEFTEDSVVTRSKSRKEVSKCVKKQNGAFSTEDSTCEICFWYSKLVPYERCGRQESDQIL